MSAVDVTFITHDGTRIEVQSSEPGSLMQIAVNAGVPGIVAECGGSCACGTCQVYVDAQWQGKLPPPGEVEAAMLEAMSVTRPNSRLSCQVAVSAELHGLVVEVPESQY